MELLVAAERGFSFADAYPIGLLFGGVAVLAAIGALSHQHERAFSASLIYLGLGSAAAIVIGLSGVGWLDPIEDATLVEKLSELALIIALFGTGLKLDRQLKWGEWTGVARLLLIAMPLTIAAVALFGTEVMGLSLGAALVLGAVLAPTDPVLAGDIGVGPPGEEDEHEPNFALTGEAGLNDGLAFPYLFAGLFVLDPGGTGWLGEWVAADVVYGLVVGAVIGLVFGYCLAAAAVRLRDREMLIEAFDGWLAIPCVLLIYGVTEIAGAYGFIAAFVGGLGFRRYEQTHDHSKRVHEGAEVVEKLGELVVILMLGSMLTLEGLGTPGLSGWLLVPVLLLVIRPAAVAIAMLRSQTPARERLFIAWFGVRGIGSLYYGAVAVAAVELAPQDSELIVWTAIACVLASIVVHGVSAAPLSRRLLPPEAQPDSPSSAKAEGGS
jgi:NhaP-type Na+/H+ or K+/H+ antiporter